MHSALATGRRGALRGCARAARARRRRDAASEDFEQPPRLVPLALLGSCEIAVERLTPGDACAGATFRFFQLGAAVADHGGDKLRTMALPESMFAADVMKAGGEVAFEEMNLPELKDELALRGSTCTGLKAVLQRRLHALLVQARTGGMDL